MSNSPRTQNRVRLRDNNRKGSEYRYGDIKAQAKKITRQQWVDRNGLPGFDLQKAIKSMQRKIDSYFGNTSKYKPHQGKKECARRLKRGTAAYYCSQTMVN